MRRQASQTLASRMGPSPVGLRDRSAEKRIPPSFGDLHEGPGRQPYRSGKSAMAAEDLRPCLGMFLRLASGPVGSGAQPAADAGHTAPPPKAVVPRGGGGRPGSVKRVNR